jgi:hypothetical protein
MKILGALIFLLLITGCSSEYPTEHEIGIAWTAFHPEEAELFDEKAITDLKCSKAGNVAVYCSYVLGGVQHRDALHKNANGEWRILMLNKEDASDD